MSLRVERDGPHRWDVGVWAEDGGLVWSWSGEASHRAPSEAIEHLLAAIVADHEAAVARHTVEEFSEYRHCGGHK